MQDLSQRKIEPDYYKTRKSFVASLKLLEYKISQASSESGLFQPCYTGRFLLVKEKIGAVSI